MERRAYVRQPITLPALVTTRSGARHAGTISDFCLGGVFVVCDGLTRQTGAVQPGEQVSIAFIADALGARKEYQLSAKVAAALEAGIGVAFVNPDPHALLVLQDLATRTPVAPAGAPLQPPSGRLPGAAGPILDECLHAVDEFLTPKLGDLFKKAGDDLFLAARDAKSNADQSKYLDAVKEVENARQAVEHTFLTETRRALTQLGQDNTGAIEATGEEQTLALVDSQEFSDLLTIKKLLELAEPRFTDHQYELDARFSELTGRRLDKHSIPISVASLCSSFHDSVQHLGASRRARLAIFMAFDIIVLTELGQLYDSLNALLAAHGILPIVERPKPGGVSRHASPPPSAEQPVDEPAVSEDEYIEPPGAQPDAGGPATPGRPPTAAPPSAAYSPWPATDSGSPPAQSPPTYRQPAGAPEQSAAGPAAVSGSLPPQTQNTFPQPAGAPPAMPAQRPEPATYDGVQPAYGPAPATAFEAAPGPQPAPPSGGWGPAPAMATPGNAYSTARSLFGLRRRARHQVEQYAPADEGAYQYHEINQALNAVQADTSGWAFGDSSGESLKSRVLAALSDHSDGTVRQLAEPQEDAISVIANLVDSILKDVLVSDGVKPRIRRLEVPLVKVAMRDEGFLADQAHPARQVVNHLGQLNLPVAPAPGSPAEKASSRVDNLVKRVVEQYDDDPTVVASVQQELAELVAQQTASYREKVQKVVTDCENQANLLSGLRKNKSPAVEQEVPAGLERGMEQVKRMRVGDVVGMHKGGRVRRETLAWASDDRGNLVFVNDQGERSSSMIGRELAINLQRGEAEVLDDASLTPVERGLLQTFEDIYEAISFDATHDPLSGLLNRKRFFEQVELALGRARGEHVNHVLAYVDLDDFSTINKVCGRKAADVLLERLAGVLARHVGDKGIAARLESDRFGMLLTDCVEERGLRIVDKYRHSIDKSNIVWKGSTLPVSVSIGMTVLSEHTADWESALEQAISASEQAKQAGGNRTHVYAPSEPAEAEVESASPDDLVGRIMDGDRLKLRCQRVTPIGEGDTSKPHYEILLGVLDEQGKLQPPTDFVHAAERSGQMTRVDRWVVENALLWMAANKRTLTQVGGFAINLSGLSLSDATLGDFVLTKLTESKVPPGKVVFEVTETAGIERLSVAGDFIRNMKEYGVRFSLDDFGTGHSSYSYLKQLPVDYVKIDGMFIREIVENENDLAVVKSVNEIGHYMGKRTIAEFVENEAILELLREIGVDYAQGHFLHEPELLSELAA